MNHPESQPFFEAAREGRLLLKLCADCNRLHYYPRAICPFCASPRTEWIDAVGRGVIYSYSVMRRADKPYAIAYVTLDEGPTMMTNLVGAAPDAWRIGMAVQVQFHNADDGTPVAVFAPA